MKDKNNNQVDLLAEYIKTNMIAKNLSSYDIEKRSGKDENGKPNITHSYANKIKNGHIKSPSAVKLKALAKGLGIVESEIFNVARGYEPDSHDITNEKLAYIDSEFQNLSEKDKQGISYLIDLLYSNVRENLKNREVNNEQ